MVVDVLGVDIVGVDVVAVIHSRDGNPPFISELVVSVCV